MLQSVFSSAWSILASILIISVFIIVHELGHFLVGKKLGFSIPEFSVGMGPRLFGWKRGETEFNVRLLPLGGYCRFLGEDETGDDDPRAMNNRPAWMRILVTAAGSVMNILFAFVLAVVTLGIFGESVLVDKTYIYSVVEGSAAEAAGLAVGDRLIEFDGRTVTDVDSAIREIGASDGTKTTAVILRGEEEMTLVITPVYDETDGISRIGVTLAQGVEQMRLGFWECVKEGYRQMVELVKAIFQFLGSFFGSLFHKAFVNHTAQVEGTEDVMSIVGVVDVMATAVREDLEFLLWLAVSISANLGVMNLLPLPALDGSRLVFQLFELITGHRMKPEHEGVVHLIGMALLLGLCVLLGWRDVARILAR